jgi:hypothetical protein
MAKDGEIGQCKDLLFDDKAWVIRYMVLDTGGWLPGKKLLISLISLGKPDWKNREFPVNLTKEQIENCPPLDEDAPISRQYEIKYFNYYKWPYYWAGDDTWGMEHFPPLNPLPEADISEEVNEDPEEHNLRSVSEVKGYNIQATDGEIGHVEDFILEDDLWIIRYLVADTRNWLPGRKVLVSPDWFHSVSWKHKKVEVYLTTDAVRNSPEYDPSQPINREHEIRLYDYYGRPSYWD